MPQVILVESEVILRNKIERVVRDAKWEPHVVNDAQSALKILKNITVEAMITACRTSRGSGLDIAIFLHNHDRTTRCLLYHQSDTFMRDGVQVDLTKLDETLPYVRFCRQDNRLLERIRTFLRQSY